ncbi:MAG: hypothetical protein JKY65_03705 [Planctomycetes bacterium]|nr:hypothetical protein [Planctomycetota bacterium]
MRQAVTLVLALTALVVFGWIPPAQAQGDMCTYCNQREIQEGENPYKCPRCVEIAKAITETADPEPRKDRAKIYKGNKVPRHPYYMLGFTHRKALGRVQIKDDTGHVENYWYLIYKIKNKHKDLVRTFVLDVRAYSDRGKNKFEYHDIWIPEAYQEIRKHLGLRKGGQLLSMRKLSTKPEGEENVLPAINDKKSYKIAKIALPKLQPGEEATCVAIFKNFHPEMDRLNIRVRGLTNWSLKVPEYYEAPANSNDRTIREAVLELHYSRPGDEFNHGSDPIRFVKRKWVDDVRKIKADLPGIPKKD